MNIKINHGRIIGIENQTLNPILPNSDLSYVEDKDLFKEIRNYIKSEHPKLENKLTFADNVMKNSNTYLVTAVDMFSKKYHSDYRIPTQADLETDLNKFKGFYVDSGLALRNLTGANKEQAEYLFDQLKSRGIKIENFPLWLNLRGLELDSNLNFNLTDESIFSTEPSLNWASETKYSKVNSIGLPEAKDASAPRQIWTADNALSRCYLDWGSYLGSNNSGLAYSDDDGRVVLAKTC